MGLLGISPSPDPYEGKGGVPGTASAPPQGGFGGAGGTPGLAGGVGSGGSGAGGVYGGGSGAYLTMNRPQAGGALAWKNGIVVTPGLSLQIRVTAGGAARIIWGGGRSFPYNAGDV